ncbi:MAG: hypothetical protein [aquatic viral metagenome]
MVPTVAHTPQYVWNNKVKVLIMQVIGLSTLPYGWPGNLGATVPVSVQYNGNEYSGTYVVASDGSEAIVIEDSSLSTLITSGTLTIVDKSGNNYPTIQVSMYNTPVNPLGSVQVNGPAVNITIGDVSNYAWLMFESTDAALINNIKASLSQAIEQITYSATGTETINGQQYTWLVITYVGNVKQFQVQATGQPGDILYYSTGVM